MRDLPVGVYRNWHDCGKPFRAALSIDGRMKNLGYFATPDDAANAVSDFRRLYPKRERLQRRDRSGRYVR